MMKRCLVFVLLIVLVSQSGFAVVMPSPFGPLLHDYGFIAGNGSDLNEFGSIKRSEMISILVSLEPEALKAFKVPKTPTFKDVPSNHWAYKNIEFAYAIELTAGKGGGLFGVNDEINYNQACLMLANRLGLDLEGVGYTTAAQQIGEKYGLKLKNDKKGSGSLYRDEVFELYAKALYMAAVEGRELLVEYGFEPKDIDVFIEAFKQAEKDWNAH